MIKTEPIIAVNDVEKSSKWYQQILGCKSNHGGSSFEILTDDKENHVLSLHKWGEHHHPTFINSHKAGNGLILYFLVEDIDIIWDRANAFEAVIEKSTHLNKNSGRREFSLRDLDNYYLSICSDNN